jgi:hypothetical protein
MDILSFTRESHVIDGVEDSRVSFEAMKDWLKRAVSHAIVYTSGKTYGLEYTLDVDRRNLGRV